LLNTVAKHLFCLYYYISNIRG